MAPTTTASVGDTITRKNERTAGLFWIRSIACSLWLMAKDYKPVSVEMSADGSGAVLYGFNRDIEAALPLWHEHRRYLNALTTKAQISR